MNTSTNEYLPHTNGNGNGHSNGNHRPPFRLAPIESPEEEARTEVLREIAPKVRRKIREDSRLSAGSKFFFYALFDDCFWHQVGGHGTGQIYADVRTLSERYGHDGKSILAWRDQLVDAGWLWTNYEWPMTEWRLTPLMPAPHNSPHKKAVQMALGRATVVVGESPTTSPNSGNTSSGRPGGSGNGKNGHRPLEKIPSPVGDSPDECRSFSHDSVGDSPTSDGKSSYDVLENFPRAMGKAPTSDGRSSHDQGESLPTPPRVSTRPLGQKSGREKTPGSKESGAKEGGKGQQPPPDASQAPKTSKEEAQLAAWRQSHLGSHQSRLEGIRKKLVSQKATATAPNVKKFIGRKISILDELIDGPLPEPEEAPAPAPRRVDQERNRPLSAEEVLEGARYLVETGKTHLLTKVQREALGRV